VVAPAPAATPDTVLARRALSGLAAVVAMECGWVVTEVGRQPWVVYHLQTTAQVATTNGGVITSLSIVIVIYALLGAATILILRMLSRRWQRADTEEQPVPYGPPEPSVAGTVR
jgi:cytochrome d ubiquinol oxidase subunit I